MLWQARLIYSTLPSPPDNGIIWSSWAMTTLGAKRPLHLRVPIHLCSPSGQDYSSEGFARGSRSRIARQFGLTQSDVRKALAADKT